MLQQSGLQEMPHQASLQGRAPEAKQAQENWVTFDKCLQVPYPLNSSMTPSGAGSVVTIIVGATLPWPVMQPASAHMLRRSYGAQVPAKSVLVLYVIAHSVKPSAADLKMLLMKAGEANG